MRLRALWRLHKNRRFLKKHGCETWREYYRKYDPHINRRATKILDYYRGYPHVYCFEDHDHLAYEWQIHINGIYVIDQWCKENLIDRCRFDFHRCIKNDRWWGDGHWHVNEIGGGDYIFFACRNETDFLKFLLRWS